MKKNSTKVAVVGDSRIFPRVEDDKKLDSSVNPCETFPNLLREKGITIDCYGYGGLTSRRILNILGYLERSGYDYYILTFGIVDLAPRALRAYEVIILSKLGIRFGKKVNKFFRKYRKISRTNTKEFETVCKLIIDLIDKRKLVVFTNPYPISESYEKIVPRIGEQIAIYNKILKNSFSNIIELDGYKVLSNDNIHFTVKGHKHIAANIRKFILK
tara:strand:- start:5261 stop:5905 length:645 start_codon:yes stop_codon:yes gene_type:complete